MVLTLDGNSEKGAQVRSNLCYLICLRHLIWSRVFNKKKSEMTYFTSYVRITLWVTISLKKNYVSASISLQIQISLLYVHQGEWTLYGELVVLARRLWVPAIDTVQISFYLSLLPPASPVYLFTILRSAITSLAGNSIASQYHLHSSIIYASCKICREMNIWFAVQDCVVHRVHGRQIHLPAPGKNRSIWWLPYPDVIGQIL